MNIRSLSKNFDVLDILRDSHYSFNMLLTETWCTDSTLKSNSNLHLPNFDLISQERKTNKRGGGVLIYIHKRLKCNLRNDLCVSDKDKEILTIEVSRENDKNTLLSCCYRPPNSDSENLSTFLQNNVIEKSVSEKKISYMIGDFNMNSLKYHETAKTKYFYDNVFEKDAIPIIDRLTRISEHSPSLIDIDDTFLKTLTDIYDANFPIREYILKDKDIKTRWIGKGLKKSSKTKQRVYIKFLKTKTLEDEFK